MRRLLLLGLLAACVPPRPESSAVTPPTRPDTVTLYVAGTTDVHGALRGWDYFANVPDSSRGLTRIATIVDSLRKAHPDRVVLVDAGDDLQGTPITSVALRDSSLPNPIIAAMNALHYDAGVIGNHEFNYGLPYLNHAIAQATFPMIAANVYTPEGRQVYVPWVMVQRGGARVAIVGATTPGSMIWDRDKLRGRIEVRDIVPSVRESVAEARVRGAEVVIVVLHSGLDGPSSYDTASTGVPGENVSARVAHEVPGIDVIVFGHSHRELADSIINGVLLSQPRNGAASLSVDRLELVRDGARYRVASRHGTLIRARGHAEQEAVMSVTEGAHARAMAFDASTCWRAGRAPPHTPYPKTPVPGSPCGGPGRM